MILKSRVAPHIRYRENTRIIMGDVLLAMFFIYCMAFYYYGPRVIALGLTGIASALVSDWLCTFVAGKRPNLRDFSAVVTGMMVPLLMPAIVPFRTVVIAVVFGIVVAKHPFGGVGHNVFNPAAAGFAFACICFPSTIFTYPSPTPMEHLAMFPGDEVVLANSPAFTMMLGGIPTYEHVDMALGSFPGPMGATNILVIAACLLYLVFRNTVHWESPVFFFLTVCAWAWIFPRAGMDSLGTVLFELMSGMLLFGGVFMLGDPVTTPKRSWSKAVFAIAAGIVVMLFRRYGNLEEDFAFALLLMNATVWGFDMLGERLASLIRGRKFEDRNSKEVQKKA